MIEIHHAKDRARLRRLALSAQGLLQKHPFGSGISGALEALKYLAYVQIDTISVIERAHHHVLFSRVPKYQPKMLNQLLLDRKIFEYWSHAAAFLPIDDFRFSLPYKEAIKSGQTHWFRSPDQKLMQKLLERIRSDGPLRARDVENDTGAGKSSTGWWDWKPEKKALEQLYMQGDLMVSDRSGFQKSYDLTERVLPSHVDTRTPSAEAFASHLVAQQLRCHGLVSVAGITYLRKDAALKKAVQSVVAEGLETRIFQQIGFNGQVFIVPSDALERRAPAAASRVQILSPFDNCVIQRQRLKALFDFDYQIECYVPEAKRKFGYFCLPLLYRDQFLGLIDCKAQRGIQTLEIKSLHLNEHPFDPAQFFADFAAALRGFAEFQGCDSISLGKGVSKLLQIALNKS